MGWSKPAKVVDWIWIGDEAGREFAGERGRREQVDSE
jgi:hypothetical protein